METGESARGSYTAPAVGEYVRHVGKLIAIEDVTPPVKKVVDYIFESVSAKCELRFRGEVIKDLQTLNDFYGEGTGVATAIEEMQKYTADRKIAPDSEVEVVVLRIAEQCRMRLNPAAYESVRMREPFRSIDYGCKRDLPEPTQTIVWSSKNEMPNV